jgi:toxin HigB-1
MEGCRKDKVSSRSPKNVDAAFAQTPFLAALICVPRPLPDCHSLRNALQLTKMIRSIRHKGLKRLYENDDPRGVMTEHTQKLRDILARLDAACTVADMDLPGFRLHALKGELKGFWSVTVRANWRVIFRFADRDVEDVDYVDYH